MRSDLLLPLAGSSCRCGSPPGCAPGSAVTFFCVPKRKSPKRRAPCRARSALNGRTTLRSLCHEGRQRTRACGAQTALPDRYAATLMSRRPAGGTEGDPKACSTSRLGAGRPAQTAAALRYIRANGLWRFATSQVKARPLTCRPGRPAPAVLVRSQRNDGTLGERAKAYRGECRAGSQEKQGPNAVQALFFGDFLLGPQKKVTRLPGRDPAGSLKQRQAQQESNQNK